MTLSAALGCVGHDDVAVDAGPLLCRSSQGRVKHSSVGRRGVPQEAGRMFSNEQVGVSQEILSITMALCIGKSPSADSSCSCSDGGILNRQREVGPAAGKESRCVQADPWLQREQYCKQLLAKAHLKIDGICRKTQSELDEPGITPVSASMTMSTSSVSRTSAF